MCSNGDPVSAINLAAGEVAVCSFINVAEDTLAIQKRTVGGDGTFDYTGDLGSFTLTTTNQAATEVFTGLTPGVYGITETVQTGWEQTGATCDNGDTPNNVTLGAGEHVTCVFTNTKQASLSVIKLTDGGDGSFDFTSTIPGRTSFTLTTSGKHAIENIANISPGTYSITETAQMGWALDSATCSDGSDPAAIVLSPGESVICTFTNKSTVIYFPLIMKD